MNDTGVNIARRTIKNSIFSFLGYLSPLLLFCVSLPYIVHKLGVEEYGIWVLVNSIVGTMGILNLGFGDAVIKYVSKYYATGDLKKVSDIIKNSFLVYSFISVIIVLIGFFIIPSCVSFFNIKVFYKKTWVFIVRVSTIGIILNIFTMNILSIFKAIQRYDISSKVTIIRETVRIMLIVLLLYCGLGLREVALASVTGIFVGFIISFLLLKKSFPQISVFPSYEKATMKTILSFSLYSFLTGITTVAKVNLGNILIGKYLGPSFVPYFSVPCRVYFQLVSVIGSLSAVLFPLFSSLKALVEKEKIKKIFLYSSKTIGILGIGIGISIFIYSQEILAFWLGNNFVKHSKIPLQIMTIGFIFTAITVIPYQLLIGFGRIKFIASLSVISTFGLLILGILTIPILELRGVAISYFISEALKILYIYTAFKALWGSRWAKTVFQSHWPLITACLLSGLLFNYKFHFEITNFSFLVLAGFISFIAFVLIFGIFDIKFLHSQRNVILSILKSKSIQRV